MVVYIVYIIVVYIVYIWFVYIMYKPSFIQFDLCPSKYIQIFYTPYIQAIYTQHKYLETINIYNQYIFEILYKLYKISRMVYN